MKIEMGESLFYSWLRHVKECQIVQNNWKVSSKWEMLHEDEIRELYIRIDEYFENTYQYSIFKNNASLSQIIHQGECDAIGVSFDSNSRKVYAVDVAFHENGLNYGTKDETVMKVIAKCARSAMCLYGYMDTKDAEIIFASPKINKAVMEKLMPCINGLNNLLRLYGYEFKVRVIANELFNDKVLQPILLVSEGMSDTAELFMRSYQMYKMFDDGEKKKTSSTENGNRLKNSVRSGVGDRITRTEYKGNIDKNIGFQNVNNTYERNSELKIGRLVQQVMKPLIISKATEEEIRWMQDEEYCKANFGLNYPLLLKTSSPKKEIRYYKDLFEIKGETYRLCSEWYETEANNDRPYVERWIKEHEDK